MNFKNLKKGEVLSEQQFYTVVTVKGEKVQLKNDVGVEYESNNVENWG